MKKQFLRNLSLLMIAILMYGNCLAQQSNIAWDFPIKPGTEAWSLLNSSQEMIDACQIPENILYNLSTPDLTKLCITYPLLGDILLANNYQEGFDKISKTFNGFDELFKS